MEILSNAVRRITMAGKKLMKKRPSGYIPKGRRTPAGAMGGMDPALRNTPTSEYEGRPYYKR